MNDQATQGSPPSASPALAPTGCSVETLAYARGYSAGKRQQREKVLQLEKELASLHAFKPWGHDETVNYLLQTADVFTRAARALLEMRQETNVDEPAPQNARTEP